MKKLLATLYGVTIAAVFGVGLLFVATLMPIPGNVQVKVVKSGSMEPAIHTGSIVVIKPAASYAVGDIITFGKDTKTQIPTTHRIIAIEGTGASATYTTKGDANDTADQVVTRLSDIRGRTLFTVPFVGYALAFARTKIGFFLLVGVPALLVFIEEGLSIYREIRRRRCGRATATMQSEAVAEVPREVYVRRVADINRKKVMGAFVVLAGVGLAASGSLWGSTVSYYVNTATSEGNVMQAGIFDVQPAPQFAPQSLSAPEEESLPPAEPPVEPPADSPPADPPQEEPPAEPVIEISTGSVVIE